MAETKDFLIEDMVYVTTLLNEPGVLTVESGLPFTKNSSVDGEGFTIPGAAKPFKMSFNMSKGLNSIKVPMLPGGQRFSFLRGNINVTQMGSEGVNTTKLSENICNHQTHSGVINIS
eukprot:m.35855 g.35855  ORF g.35855 m.35855 type:complete len:117 (+) comp8974_c0_seq2:311-661(+)